MSSPLVDIPVAVVAALNGHTFSQAFTATRAYLPKWTLTDLGELHVTVVLPKCDRSQYTRASVQKIYPLNICIQKRLPSVNAADVDPMMILADEIANFWTPGIVMAGANWAGTEHDAIFLPEHLKEFSCFTSLITVHFQIN